MVCSGVVKGGKVELEAGVSLPEGATVRVEVVADEAQTDASKAEARPAQSREDWLKEWDKLAEEVTAAWKSPKSALEILSEMRR
jgi:hypothetical protein